MIIKRDINKTNKQLTLNIIGVIGCWVVMILIGLSACYVKDNRTSQLIKPVETEEGKKGTGLDQS